MVIETDEAYNDTLESTGLTEEIPENSLTMQDSSKNQVDEKTPFKETQDYTDNSKDKASFYSKLVSEREYRHKVMTSMALILSFIMLGWIVGQVGPSFLDLQIITDTTLEKATAFFTSNSVGYLTGSFIFGVMFDHVPFEKILLVFLTVVGSAVTLAFVPWCTIYELMIFIHILKGIFSGGLDTTGNAHLLMMWGNDGKSFMQALHFAFAFGGIISPFVVAPFLLPQDDITQHDLLNSASKQVTDNPLLNLTTVIFYNQTYTGFNDNSTSSFNDPTAEKPQSQLYIAFFISAALTFLTAIPIFFSYVSEKKNSKKKKRTDNDQTKTEDKNTSNEIPPVLKISTIVCLMFLMGVYCAIEDSFNGFLTTFCVKHMKWTKFSGASVTALFWAFFAVGRFLGIFFIRFLRPVRIILFLCLSLIISFLAFLITSLYTADAGIWICAALVGLAMSVFFPSVFTWTEGEIFPVNGRIASLFLISASAGSMINPIVLGVLMDKINPMVFSYLLLGQTVVLFAIFLLVLYLSHKIKHLKGRFGEIEIEIKCDQEVNVDKSETRS